MAGMQARRPIDISIHQIFPALRAAGARTRAWSPPSRYGRVASPRCLCVFWWPRDNVINQRIAAGILGKAGHFTTLVPNGREARPALVGNLQRDAMTRLTFGG